MDFSEYETASEFAEDFESDHEPPKDQLFLKKMIHKTEKLRIYKRIAKIGKSYLEMPAKYDQVVLNICKLKDNSLEKNLENEISKETFDYKLLSDYKSLKALATTGTEEFKSQLDEDTEVQSQKESKLRELLSKKSEGIRILQLGKDIQTEDVLLSISNMKKGEISYFEIEEIGFHPKTKERKLFGKQYYLVELIDFVTIIDVFGNDVAYKIQLDKGEGIRRVNRADQILLKLTLKTSSGETLWHFDNTEKGKSIGGSNNVQESVNVQEIVKIVTQNCESKGGQWLKTNLESILTNLKIRESAILEFPNDSEKTPKQETFDMLNKIPFCFDSSRLYLGIQGIRNNKKF